MAPDDYNFYHFTPNKIIAIIATVLFGLSAIYHIFQIWKTKAYFFAALASGAIMMTIGYILRTLGSDDPTAFGPFVGQAICIVLPPAFYAATIYMTYGRIAHYTRREKLSIIAPHKVTKIFLIGDIIALSAQSTGGGLNPQGGNLAKIGDGITVAGLFVQLVFFGFFIVVTVVFERRIRREGDFKRSPLPNWMILLYVLFAVSALIIVRCIFRIVEYIQGVEGYLATHEVYLYVFDTLPMFFVQAVFHFYHPGDILVGEEEGDEVALDP